MLSADVWPALVNAYVSQLVGVVPGPALLGTVGTTTMPVAAIRGLSEGEQLSITESPWAWLLNASGSMENKIGSDLAYTEWHFTLRIFQEWANDPTNCERILMPLIEQVREVHQRAMKLGTGTVVFSILRGVEWGYAPVNGIWYRSVDCDIHVAEKEIRNMQA